MHKTVQHSGITRLARTGEYLEQRGQWEEQLEMQLKILACYANELRVWGACVYVGGGSLRIRGMGYT